MGAFPYFIYCDVNCLFDIGTTSITAEALENAMVVAPRQEYSLFSNRDKFDLVAIYDSSSTTFGSDTTPISILVRLIWEQAFKKMLRRMPMLLVGGIEAWKKEFREKKLVRNPGYAPGIEIQKPVPLSTQRDYLAGVGVSHSRNPFVNQSASPRDSPSVGTTSPRDSAMTKSPEQSGHARLVSSTTLRQRHRCIHPWDQISGRCRLFWLLCYCS